MTDLPTLAELYAAHTGKVSDKWSSYLPTYDRLFAHLRDKPISLLEIGVQNGGSLEIWAKYFLHPNSKIVGVDINEQCLSLRYTDTRIWVAHGDATNDLDYIKTKYDIIIDDGSHKPDEQIDALSAWWPTLKDGGIYVVEDLHCDGCSKTAQRFAEIMAIPLATDSRPIGDNIARVEFLNSMIVLIKGDGSLGPRVIAGKEEPVCRDMHRLHGEIRRG